MSRTTASGQGGGTRESDVGGRRLEVAGRALAGLGGLGREGLRVQVGVAEARRPPPLTTGLAGGVESRYTVTEAENTLPAASWAERVMRFAPSFSTVSVPVVCALPSMVQEIEMAALVK